MVAMSLSDRRRVLTYVAATLVMAGAAATVAWRLTRHADEPQRSAPAPSVALTEVSRRDISTSESLPGKVGFGAVRPVSGGRDGIVTWLPAPGVTIRRGEQLFRVNDEPVPLFYGAIPLYRTLSKPGTVGRDVRIVANNLQALGYRIGRQPRTGERIRVPIPPPHPVGEKAAAAPAAKTASAPVAPSFRSVTVGAGEGAYTDALIRAVKRWQRDQGVPANGRIAAADAVVLTGAVRVSAVSALVGAPASGPLLQVSTTAKVVSVTAEAAQAATIDKGDHVTITLPDDTKLSGRVSSVGAVPQESGSGEEPGYTVAVALDDAKALTKLTGEMQVEFVAETHEDVLTVPVEALLALSEGGYAVQLQDGRLIPVRTGLYAKGFVEISGDGLKAGTQVVTAS